MERVRVRVRVGVRVRVRQGKKIRQTYAMPETGAKVIQYNFWLGG